MTGPNRFNMMAAAAPPPDVPPRLQPTPAAMGNIGSRTGWSASRGGSGAA